jgi:hypothetical protein
MSADRAGSAVRPRTFANTSRGARRECEETQLDRVPQERLAELQTGAQELRVCRRIDRAKNDLIVIALILRQVF